MLIKCKGSVPKKEAHRIRMPTQAANPGEGQEFQCAPAEALPRARGSNRHSGNVIAIKPASVR